MNTTINPSTLKRLNLAAMDLGLPYPVFATAVDEYGLDVIIVGDSKVEHLARLLESLGNDSVDVAYKQQVSGQLRLF